MLERGDVSLGQPLGAAADLAEPAEGDQRGDQQREDQEAERRTRRADRRRFRKVVMAGVIGATLRA